MTALLHAEDHDRIRAEIDQGLTSEGRYELEHRISRVGDGAVLWVANAGVLIGGSRRRSG